MTAPPHGPVPAPGEGDPTRPIPTWDRPELPQPEAPEVPPHQVVTELNSHLDRLVEAAMRRTQHHIGTAATRPQVTSVYENVRGFAESERSMADAREDNIETDVNGARDALGRYITESSNPDMCVELFMALIARRYGGEGNKTSVVATEKAAKQAATDAKRRQDGAARGDALRTAAQRAPGSSPGVIRRFGLRRRGLQYDGSVDDAQIIHMDSEARLPQPLPRGTLLLPGVTPFANYFIERRALKMSELRHGAHGVETAATRYEIAAEQAVREAEIADHQHQLSRGILDELVDLARLVDEARGIQREQEEQQRVQQRAAVLEARTDVVGLLDHWRAGTHTTQIRIAEIGNALDRFRETIGDLRGSFREEATRMWVTLAARYHGRRATAADQSVPDAPHYTPDGAVEIVAADGQPVRLYLDGTTARQESGAWVRRDADGSEVQHSVRDALRFVARVARHRLNEVGIDGLVRAPRGAVREFADQDDQSLGAAYEDALQAWETRGSQASRETAHAAAEALYLRLVPRIDEHRGQLHTIGTALQEASRLLALRQGDPDQLAAEIAARDEITIDEARAQLPEEQDLRQRVADLRSQTRAIEQFIRHFGPAANSIAHSLGLLTAERDGDRVSVTREGNVLLQRATINGITGTWIVTPDGRAALYDPATGRYQEHDALGEPVLT